MSCTDLEFSLSLSLYKCAVKKDGYIFLPFPSARRTEDICVFRRRLSDTEASLQR